MMSVVIAGLVGYLLGLAIALGLLEVEHAMHRDVRSYRVPLMLNVGQTLACCCGGALLAVWVVA